MNRAARFDDRAVDFLSGRKVSPPMEDRRHCACCGLRIVKGFLMSNGDAVGEDCEEIISRATLARSCGHAANAGDFDQHRKRSTGWTLKPAVRSYIGQTVFA